jgi:hypothetical protein
MRTHNRYSLATVQGSQTLILFFSFVLCSKKLCNYVSTAFSVADVMVILLDVASL